MKLIITRHGETEENKAGIIQGHLQGHLSEKGKWQAKQVALRLKNERIDCIYSSDLARAANTAQEIAKFHPNISFELVQDLREKYLGNWQGKTKKELGFNNLKSVADIFCEKGEPTEKLYKRARNFLEKIYSEHSDKTVLFVGHNGINKAIVAVITGKDESAFFNIENQHNTAITVFNLYPKDYEMIDFNCVKHLKT